MVDQYRRDVLEMFAALNHDFFSVYGAVLPRQLDYLHVLFGCHTTLLASRCLPFSDLHYPSPTELRENGRLKYIYIYIKFAVILREEIFRFFSH